jgi:hypothetical protein
MFGAVLRHVRSSETGRSVLLIGICKSRYSVLLCRVAYQTQPCMFQFKRGEACPAKQLSISCAKHTRTALKYRRTALRKQQSGHIAHGTLPFLLRPCPVHTLHSIGAMPLALCPSARHGTACARARRAQARRTHATAWRFSCSRATARSRLSVACWLFGPMMPPPQLVRLTLL